MPAVNSVERSGVQTCEDTMIMATTLYRFQGVTFSMFGVCPDMTDEVRLHSVTSLTNKEDSLWNILLGYCG